MSAAEHLLEFLVVGDSGVGKSCLISRFVDDRFPARSSVVAVGPRVVQVNGQAVKVHEMDIEGLAGLTTLTEDSVHDITGIMICYDIKERRSYDRVWQWLVAFDACGHAGTNKMLVGLRCDDTTQRRVSVEEAQEYAWLEGLSFKETSSRLNINVDEAFNELALGGATISRRVVTLSPASAGCVDVRALDGSVLFTVDADKGTTAGTIANHLYKILEEPRPWVQMVLPSGLLVERKQLRMPLVSVIRGGVSKESIASMCALDRH